MNQINWPFSDTIAGYVTSSDAGQGTFTLKNKSQADWFQSINSTTTVQMNPAFTAPAAK